MTQASRMQEITRITLEILNSDKSQTFTISQLARLVNEKGILERGVTGFDIREAVWRLVDSREASFTSAREITAFRKSRQLGS